MTDPELVDGALKLAELKYVGEPVARTAGNLAERAVGPSFDELGMTLREWFVEWKRERAGRAAQIVLDATASIHRRGLTPQTVPGRIIWPILERGSLEEEPDLYRRWVASLASAGTKPDDFSHAFTNILAALSPREAAILDFIRDTTEQFEIMSIMHKFRFQLTLRP